MRRRQRITVQARPNFDYVVDDTEARRRARRMAAFDALPANVRAAIRDSNFWLDILIPRQGLNMQIMLERVEAVQTYRDAVAFMNSYGGGGWR